MSNTSSDKAFATFLHGSIRYLAIPVEGGVYIIDEDGRGYGAWFTVKAFKDVAREEKKPLCRVRLSKTVVDTTGLNLTQVEEIMRFNKADDDF